MQMLWLSLGCLALASGFAGLVLPLVPTTPFLILAAFCFARSSPTLHEWLVSHPRLGPPIEMWREHRAISMRAKVSAVVVMALTFLFSLLIGVGSFVLIVQASVMLVVAAFLVTRPTGPANAP